MESKWLSVIATHRCARTHAGERRLLSQTVSHFSPPLPLHTFSATSGIRGGRESVSAFRVIKRCHGVRGKRMPANFTAPDPNKSCRGVTRDAVGQVREVYGVPVTRLGGLGQVLVSRHGLQPGARTSK